MAGFLSGLVELHARNILHRDIKTSNLLMSAAGVVKIADFGLAKQLTDDENKLTPTVVTLWFRCSGRCSAGLAQVIVVVAVVAVVVGVAMVVVVVVPGALGCLKKWWLWYGDIVCTTSSR